MSDIELQRWVPNNPSSVMVIKFHKDDADAVRHYFHQHNDDGCVYLATGHDLALESWGEFLNQVQRYGEELVQESWFLRVWSGNRCRTSLLIDNDYIVLWDNGDVTVKTTEEMQMWGHRIVNHV